MTVCLGSTGVYSCWSFCNSGGVGGEGGGLAFPKVICTLLIFGALFGEWSIFLLFSQVIIMSYVYFNIKSVHSFAPAVVL